MSGTDSNRPNGGRSADGRFVTGNRGGPGNPHLRHAAALQRAVREAVTGNELQQVLRKLRDQALEGDTAAARLLIERAIGKPSDEPRCCGGCDWGHIRKRCVRRRWRSARVRGRNRIRGA